MLNFYHVLRSWPLDVPGPGAWSRGAAGASAVLAMLCIGAPLAAQEARETRSAPRVLHAAALEGELVLDGVLDEAAWQAAPVATDFVQQRPQPGDAATERTEVRVLHDARYLYVGMRMYDSRPDSIAAQLGRRDATGLYSDWAQVVIDSYHDRRTAFRFAVTPRGVMRDVLHFDDRNEDGSWNAVWEVATSIDDEGWTAEFRIPFSQLRFSTDGARELVWGVNFIRDIARKEERAYWSPMPPQEPGFVSRFGELHGLRAIAAPRRLELAPYAATRLTRAPLTHERDPFWRGTDPGADLGVDVMYGLGPQLTLSATINPDFGQVEVDPAVVNLSAFPTFFPERRPFFLEGADIFRFGINIGDGGSETLFYTRRIGREPQRGMGGYDRGFVDSPPNTRILGAAKLSGQTGPWSIGVMHALTRAEHATLADTLSGEQHSLPVEPLSNYSVARVIRSFRQGQSRVGSMLTASHRAISEDRLRPLPAQAYAWGADGRHRFGDGNFELSGWLAASHVRGDTLALQRVQRAAGRYFHRPDAEHLAYDPQRTALSGWAGNLRIGRVGGGRWRYGWIGDVRSPGFEVNDLGFQRGADRLITGVYVNWLRPEPIGPFRSLSFFADPLFVGWSFGGERTHTGSSGGGNFDLKNNWNGWFGGEHQRPTLSTTALWGGPAIRRQAATGFWGGINSDRRHSIYGTLAADGGVEHGTAGYRYSLNPSLNYRPAPHLQLSVGPSYSRNVDAWQHYGANTLARLDQTTVSLNTRMNVTFTPRMTLELFAQPFVSAGEYSELKRVVDPRAPRFEDRFDYLATDPDDGFNIRSLRGNAVFRWEYRPGSALFLVWQQQRQGFADVGDFSFDRDFSGLFRAPATNVLMLKATYWFGG
jgi:hypothetical protein